MSAFAVADAIHDLERTLESLKDAWVVGDHVRYRSLASMLQRMAAVLEDELEGY